MNVREVEQRHGVLSNGAAKAALLLAFVWLMFVTWNTFHPVSTQVFAAQTAVLKDGTFDHWQSKLTTVLSEWAEPTIAFVVVIWLADQLRAARSVP